MTGVQTCALPIYKHERPFVNCGIVRLNEEPGGLAGRNLNRGDQITDRPKISLQLTACLFYDLRVEADAGELNEKFLVRFRQVHRAGAVRLNNIPAKFEIMNGQAELGCEHIHRADWEEAERGAGPGQSVHHVVDCSIAARS